MSGRKEKLKRKTEALERARTGDLPTTAAVKIEKNRIGDFKYSSVRAQGKWHLAKRHKTDGSIIKTTENTVKFQLPARNQYDRIEDLKRTNRMIAAAEGEVAT
jgi:hypothetical protein